MQAVNVTSKPKSSTEIH